MQLIRIKDITQRDQNTPAATIDLNTAYKLLDKLPSAESTKKKYKQNIVHFVNMVQKVGLHKKTLLQFEAALVQPILKKNGVEFVTNSTKKGYLAAAAKLIDQINLYGDLPIEIPKKTAGSIKIAKGHKDGLTHFEVMKIEELISQIKNEKKRLKINAMFHLFAYRGLRQIEVQGIRIEHINFETNTIRFRRKGQEMIKFVNSDLEDYSKYENHNCPRKVMKVVKAYVDSLGVEKGFLFHGQKIVEVDGKQKRIKGVENKISLSAFKKIFTERREDKTAGLFKKAGVKPIREAKDDIPALHKSLHGLRHFIGTYMSDKGYPPAAIAKYLGHSTLGMVMTYVDGKENRELMDRLDKDFLI